MTLLATAGVVATQGSAFAADRVDCTSYNFTWVLSGQPTCWANAGKTDVTLIGVYGVNSGNNTGYLASPSGYVYFTQKYHNYSFSSRRIDAIDIY